MDSGALGAAQRGDREAFGALLRPLLSRALRLAVSLLDNAAEAEDAVQDATLTAWRSIIYLRDPEALESWFLKIVANRCRQVRRTSRWRAAHVELGNESAGAVEEQVVRGEEIRRALDRLSHDHRLVLSLHFYLDLGMEEVAAVLGVPTGTAKSRLSRALQNMRPWLEAPRGALE